MRISQTRDLMTLRAMCAGCTTNRPLKLAGSRTTLAPHGAGRWLGLRQLSVEQRSDWKLGGNRKVPLNLDISHRTLSG